MYLHADPRTTATWTDRAYQEYGRQFSELQKERDAFELQAAPALSRLVKLPSWGEVKSLSFYNDKLDIYLARPDSALPREIAIEFEAKGDKYSLGEALYVHFDLGNVLLDVNGYVPATCKIVEVEEYVPGEIRKVKKVVCTE